MDWGLYLEDLLNELESGAINYGGTPHLGTPGDDMNPFLSMRRHGGKRGPKIVTCKHCRMKTVMDSCPRCGKRTRRKLGESVEEAGDMFPSMGPSGDGYTYSPPTSLDRMSNDPHRDKKDYRKCRCSKCGAWDSCLGDMPEYLLQCDKCGGQMTIVDEKKETNMDKRQLDESLDRVLGISTMRPMRPGRRVDEMALSRKHYEAIAQILMSIPTQGGLRAEVVKKFSYLFAEDNSNFDSTVFARAAGVETDWVQEPGRPGRKGYYRDPDHPLIRPGS